MGKLFSILGVALLLVASTASAADDKAADAPADEAKPAADEAKPAEEKPAEAKPAAAAGEVKYGTAGCGLGSILFGPGTGFSQVFAATTNGSSANQTFAISSGTSNCDASAPSAKSAKAYVETNRAALAKDIARGKGETLKGLAELGGCKHPNAVGTKLQSQFKVIFPSAQTTDAQVSETVVEMLGSDASLGCSNLS